MLAAFSGVSDTCYVQPLTSLYPAPGLNRTNCHAILAQPFESLILKSLWMYPQLIHEIYQNLTSSSIPGLPFLRNLSGGALNSLSSHYAKPSKSLEQG
jgi:hypothetical protein